MLNYKLILYALTCISVFLLFEVRSCNCMAKWAKIIGGRNAQVENFPWVAKIFGKQKSKWDFFGFFNRQTHCGAALISKKWLLTAAHCFHALHKGKIIDFTNPKQWHVRLGSEIHKPNAGQRIKNLGSRLWNKFSPKEKSAYLQYYHIEKILLHPKYDNKNIEYDIALMKIKENIPWNNNKIKHIDLPLNFSQSFPSTESTCYLAGWGCSQFKGRLMHLLQQSKMPILSANECKSNYVHELNLTTAMEFCAGYYLKGIGICSGDSGSCLACRVNNKWYAAGIASATHNQFPGSYPGIFTRVQHFNDWIKQITQL